MNWVKQTHKSAEILHAQLAEARKMADQGIPNAEKMVAIYQREIERHYEESLPLSRLLDESDIICHAEGPATRSFGARTNAVIWMYDQIRRRVKDVAIAAATELQSQREIANRDLHMLITGTAPGSLYTGFKLASASLYGDYDGPALLPIDHLEFMRTGIRMLPEIPDFISMQGVTEGLYELIPDPALRDAALIAAYHLSPTTRRGIDTLELSIPGQQGKNKPFTPLSREIIKQSGALTRGVLGKVQTGSFHGSLRGVDLDNNRFILRGVPGIGSIRCAMEIDQGTARKYIGNDVIVTGDYEATVSGRPAMLRVNSIKPAPQQKRAF